MITVSVTWLAVFSGLVFLSGLFTGLAMYMHHIKYNPGPPFKIAVETDIDAYTPE